MPSSTTPDTASLLEAAKAFLEEAHQSVRECELEVDSRREEFAMSDRSKAAKAPLTRATTALYHAMEAEELAKARVAGLTKRLEAERIARESNRIADLGPVIAAHNLVSEGQAAEAEALFGNFLAAFADLNARMEAHVAETRRLDQQGARPKPWATFAFSHHPGAVANLTRAAGFFASTYARKG